MAAEPSATIRLDHFLKSVDAVQTGGHAKVVIQDGQVTVDGEPETRRRRQLTPGMVVGFGGQTFVVPEGLR